MGGDYDGAYLCALLAPVDAVARPALAMQDKALTVIISMNSPNVHFRLGTA